jgi:hypothetical protein
MQSPPPRPDLGPASRSTYVLRFAAGAAIAAAANAAATYIKPGTSVAAVDWTTALLVLAAQLFGWLGLAGSLLGDIAVEVARGHFRWPGTLIRMAALSIPALLALIVFSRSRKVARWIPDLRSYLALATVALVGGTGAGWLAARMTFRSWHPVGGWIWSAGIATGILLVVPPLAALLGRLKHPLLGRLVVGRADAPDAAEWAEVKRPPALREMLEGTGVVIGTTALALLASRTLPAAEPWLDLLFALPILRGTTLFGLQGGIYAGSAVGIAFLSVRSLLFPGGAPFQSHQEAVAFFPALLTFCLLGAVVGALRDRELSLNRSLERANRMLREDLDRSVRALTAAVEAKDGYTEGHVSRVQRYAERVGQALELPEDEMKALRSASVLHDVGKIGIPDQVLNKADALSVEERKVMERHSELGARILANVSGMEGVARLVLHHQERFDGRRDAAFPGYPGGLRGEEIPLGSRIIAVVDAFDAMTTDRPYRKRRPFPAAVEELRRERGKQFDARVVDAFLGGLEEEAWSQHRLPSASSG